jgi:hypothetical protein
MAQQRRDLEEITQIIIHCSDSDNPWHDNIETVREWHKQFGFDDIGYHYFIPKNKFAYVSGRPLEIVGAHCLGQNKNSIGICISGKTRFAESQFAICAILCEGIAKHLGWPNLYNRIFPHTFYNKLKTCLNFPIQRIIDLLEY